MITRSAPVFPPEKRTHAAVVKNLKAGQHTVAFIVDPDNRITESNEENNRGTFSFDLPVKDCTGQAGKQQNPRVGQPNQPGGGQVSQPHPRRGWELGNNPVVKSISSLAKDLRTWVNGLKYALLKPAISVKPREGPHRTPVTVTGSNWEAGERVCISSLGLPLDEMCTKANSPGFFGTGGFTKPISVPKDATEGKKTIHAYSLTSSRKAKTEFTVTPDPLQKGAEGSISLPRMLVDLACKLHIIHQDWIACARN
jgi:hypothetical protein